MFRKICVFFVGWFLRFYFKLDIVNCERFEKLKTGCIVAPNHISAWETLIIPTQTKRVMWMMAKEELFKNKISAFVFKHVKAFPISRGKKDFGALKKAIQLVKNGNALCMFPQGTRRKFGEKLRFKPGAVMIAYEAKVPIVPVGVVPHKDYKFRSRVTVVYGEPFYLNDYYDKDMTKEDFRKLTVELEERVQKAIDSVKGE